MKIIVAGGQHSADYIIKTFKRSSNKLVVIVDNKEYAQYLSKINKIPVFYGEAYKKDILEQAHINNADIFIALGEKDCDNYVACLLAKKCFGVKKCICIVSNPNNVDIFKELGVDSVISSTQLLASSIISESSVESLIKAVSLENEKIVLTEIVVRDNYEIAHKRIVDVYFPRTGNISCIYRKPNVIIPNGTTLILPKDKLIIASTPQNQKEIIDFVQKIRRTNG